VTPSIFGVTIPTFHISVEALKGTSAEGKDSYNETAQKFPSELEVNLS
jgi:hypothetical protein